MTEFFDHELQELADDCLRDELSAEGTARLELLLREHREARRGFLEFIYDSYSLRRWAEVESDPPPAASPPFPLASLLAQLGTRGWRLFSHHPSLFSVLAMMVLAGVVLVWSLVWRKEYLGHNGLGPTAAPSVETAGGKPGVPRDAPVARIICARDCRWTAADAALTAGCALPPGKRIDIAKGQVEIAFDCGATVVLHGPGLLTVESPRSARLLRGSVLARPGKARGQDFTISTPAISVVGLGGEFHLRAGPGGDSQVCVTAGAVNLRSAAGHRRLDAGQGIQIGPGEADMCALVEHGDNTRAFRFPTIKPPPGIDYADAMQKPAIICTIKGEPLVQSGLAGGPADGGGQLKISLARTLALLADDEYSNKLVLDLERNARVLKVNTYSWHRGNQAGADDDSRPPRAPQRYVLYGFSGDSPPPARGDPTGNGWTLIGRVNTDEFFATAPSGDGLAQQAVSIARGHGDIGRYRFLLWHVWGANPGASPRASAADKSQFNIRICEIDIYVD